MRVLALNPYHGGSHQSFLDGWINHSRHDFTVLTLPAYKWKWRMRHSAVTFAEQSSELIRDGQSWDIVFCTDMLNLSEFKGLADNSIAQTPTVVYFHENQLTYPFQESHERDLHFAYTNFTTALVADQVWFNSQFHQDVFLNQLDDFLSRMPDHRHVASIEQLKRKSEVHSPGVDVEELIPESQPNTEGDPLRIVWAARWEHDKDPETFFNALEQLTVDFRVSVLGQSFGETPKCFGRAKEMLADKIIHWGHVGERHDYINALQKSDVVVSTALHEFFGIAIVEAVTAGCFPLVPRRLAYPEVLGHNNDFYFDGSATGLATRLSELAQRKHDRELKNAEFDIHRRLLSRFDWKQRSKEMDLALEEIV